MKKYLIAAIFLGCALSLPVSAWSVDGHVVVTDLAVKQLSGEQARELERIARLLETQFDFDQRMINLRSFGEASDLAKIAAFPDRVRDELLGGLFARFGAQVPPSLQPFANQDTASWHYINVPYASEMFDASQCQITADVNLRRILPLLVQAYDEAADDTSRALVLAFLVHLVADAHQPLHTLSRVDSDCRHDLGGNLFCADNLTAAGSCRANLHALWDGAAGYFDRFDQYSTLRDDFLASDRFPPPSDKTDIDDWIDENMGHARFVYSLRENRPVDGSYLDDATRVSFARLSAAATRLADVLRDL